MTMATENSTSKKTLMKSIKSKAIYRNRIHSGGRKSKADRTAWIVTNKQAR